MDQDKVIFEFDFNAKTAPIEFAAAKARWVLDKFSNRVFIK